MPEHTHVPEVPLEKLRWQCAPESLGFKTTDEIEACQDLIGQERAMKALRLGLQLKAPGYNIYVAGAIGTGKATAVKSILDSLKETGPIPNDICYVHNFQRPNEPRVIYLPAGRGVAFARDMDALVTSLKNTVLSNSLTKESKKPRAENNRAAKRQPRGTAAPLIQNQLLELKQKYANARVAQYLDAVQSFLLSHLECLQASEAGPAPNMPVFPECRVNVVVDNSHLQKAPVIFETAPTYHNLFGVIERVRDRDGEWRTDFFQIKAGSLARANGGYLVLNLFDMSNEPGVWRTLMRTLRNRRLEIQVYDPLYAMSAAALKPEPIDLDLKVVVMSDYDDYYHLYRHDDDFKEIFKIRADFDTLMPNEPNAHRQYAGFVKKICQQESLPPFDNSAVAAVIEYGVWLAGRQAKISTRFGEIADLLREASFWARDENSPLVSRRHVERAIAEKIYRLRSSEERMLERIRNGALMIAVEGNKLGQVNALLVYDYGDYCFGRPSRITAEVGMGSAGVINIEREADLSGKTHNKGVAIISGYLRGKYAYDKSLSMSVSIAVEQSYNSVEGDSASAAEVYAILSALSGLPVRQDLAVTGSLNQKGEIQSIGAANEKIEGFFNACKAKGLTGTQGVIIPQQNLDDLMLRQEVIDAVANGQFHIYAIKAIDEGLELLIGVPAGEKNTEGKYPEGTVHYKVDQRLCELAKGKKEEKSAEEKK